MIIAFFSSINYREDDRCLGVFSTEALAEEAIQDYIRTDKNIYPNHPARDQQKRRNYYTRECELNERIFV